MGGISSLSIALSGLQAAQAGLYVTGHNISNAGVKGYSRQQAMQVDFISQTIGFSGPYAMQVGLGTDINAIRQIRDKYLDVPFREASSKLGYYETKYSAGLEIESIFSELEGSYKMQSVLTDLWQTMQEIEGNPTAIETRANFIESALEFVDKFRQAYDDLYSYQLNLNEQVKAKVQRVNQLVSQIDALNKKIKLEEACGANANDYRDSRNLAMDELSGLIDVEYKETVKGINIICEGRDLLMDGVKSTLGLRYTSPEWGFVEPVFTTRTDILSFDEQAATLFHFTTTNPKLNARPVNPQNKNDNGSLKALMVARGMSPANYTESLGQLEPQRPDPTAAKYNPGGVYDQDLYEQDKRLFDYKVFNADSALTPRIQMELDTLFNGVVKLVNDTVTPPYDVYDAAFTFPGNMPVPNPPALSLPDKIIMQVPLTDANGVATTPPKLVWGVVDTVNNLVESYVPFDLSFNQPFMEIFSRKAPPYDSRYQTPDPANPATDPQLLYKYIAEDPPDIYSNGFYSRYTLGNVTVNPLFSNTQGYSKIAVAKTPEVHSKTIMEDIVNKWSGSDKSWGLAVDDNAERNVQDYYKWLVTELGIDIGEARAFVEAEYVQVEQAEYIRQAIMGASLDEEMKNMMIYQHAYNASARIANVIDGMCDRIINHTGRVGL